jgi:hypothetical protein
MSKAWSTCRLPSAGQGVILMAVHFTTLEIGAALLGQQHTIDGMYREHGNPLFDFIQRRGRERHNLDSLAVERDDVRGMLKLLRGPGDLVRARPGLRRQAEHLRAAVRHPGRHRHRHQQVRPPGQGLVMPFTQKRLADGSGYRLVIHPPLEGFPARPKRPIACASTSGSKACCASARSNTCGRTGASSRGLRASRGCTTRKSAE